MMRIGEIQVTKTRLEVDTEQGKVEFQEVDEFVYLGARITCKCDEVKEIEARLSKANRCAGAMNHLIRAKQLSRSTKIRIYKTILRPTALYGCETWVLNKNIQEILMRWERKMIRIVGGKKTGDGCTRTNGEIYDIYKEPKIDMDIKTRRLQWLGHIKRMAEDRTVKKIAWSVPDC